MNKLSFVVVTLAMVAGVVWGNPVVVDGLPETGGADVRHARIARVGESDCIASAAVAMARSGAGGAGRSTAQIAENRQSA